MEAYLELSPSTDDLTALGIKSELVNPSVNEMQAEMHPVTSCTLQAENTDPAKPTLNLKVFLSFRSPTAPYPLVSDQLPKGALMIQNVNFDNLQTLSLHQFILNKARQLASNLHPCKDYVEVGIPFDLLHPRFGFWNPHEQRLLDVVDQGRELPLLHRSMAITTGATALVVASMSFVVNLEMASTASPDTQSKSAPTGANFQTPSSSCCHPDVENFNIWISELRQIAQLPENFQTLSRYTRLAADISLKLKSPLGAPQPATMKPQTTKPKQRQRRRRGPRRARGAQAQQGHAPRSVLSRLGPKPPLASHPKAKPDDVKRR